MSEKEKAYAKKLAKLPAEIQEKILDKIDGAAMALEFQKKKEEDNNAEG